jgi:eukaryotic-like serine/threonine-protein kinase
VAPAAWHQGLTVGRYSLLSRIAVGGMAEIWLARQLGPKGFEKFIVIKRILDGLGTDPEFVTMFLDEARIAAQLNHPHIVQIFDLGEEAGAFYIAMEYLPGENLANVVRAGERQQKPLPIPLAVRIIADAAEGLAYAHARKGGDGKLLGIVHRDVSPHNLIITDDGLVKVVDFGIAKAANRESQTMAGHVKGKMAYMSPEQARGEPLDGRSDVFSLGILLFEMVTRSRLFHFPDPLAALTAVASDDPLPLAHERSPEVPEELSRIIDQALARNQDRRYASARHFQVALEEWLRSQPEVPDSTELAAYMSQIFSARIQERIQLLEAARSGALTPASASRAMPGSTASSMPGGRPASHDEVTSVEALPDSRRWPWRAGIVGVVLALGLGLAIILSAEPVGSVAPPPPSPPAVPAPPVLTVETEPPGAQVLVNGKEVGVSPLTLDTLELGEHTVQAVLEGRQQAARQVKLEHPGERAMVVLVLAPEPPPTPPPAPPVDPATDPDTVRPTKKVVVPATGKLTLDTTPWTRVFLKGKSLGDTPLVNVTVPAGRHQLKLLNEEKNISAVIEVEVRAGQTTSKRLRL